MTALMWATAVGVALWTWAHDAPWWPLAAGWSIGLVFSSPALGCSGLLGAVGFSLYRRAVGFERQRNGDEQQALLFLVRLRQLLSVRGTLAAALDEMGYRASRGGDAAEHLLNDIGRQYDVRALRFVGSVAVVVRRHGGSLIPVIDWASDAVRERQQRRQIQHLEDVARRSTLEVLAWAPLGVIGLFRLMVPSLFHTLNTTEIGQITEVAVGAITLGVMAVQAWSIQLEAKFR